MSLISFSPLQDGVTSVAAAATNTPLNTIYDDYNGNITDANIASNAAIAGSKISYASTSNPYKFSVYRAAAQTVTTAGLVLFDTKLFDTGSNVDVVTNKGRFTAPVSGFYQFDANVAMNINANANVAYAFTFIKNGSLQYAGFSFVNSYAGAWALQLPGSKLLQLTAGDYVEVYVSACSGTGTPLSTGQYSTYFDGFLVSAT